MNKIISLRTKFQIPKNFKSQVLTRENEEDVVVQGLWACGETACTSVHGANRLGANSLLELLVFGKAVAENIGELTKPEQPLPELPKVF